MFNLKKSLHMEACDQLESNLKKSLHKDSLESNMIHLRSYLGQLSFNEDANAAIDILSTGAVNYKKRKAMDETEKATLTQCLQGVAMLWRSQREEEIKRKM